MWLSSRPTTYHTTSTTRASVPIIGCVLLIGLAVAVITLLGTTLFGVTSTPGSQPTTATVALTVDDDTLRFTHSNGEPLDVQTLSVRIFVDGEPLDKQPPVPFFAAAGFESGPTGPFNTASDDEWTVGETASLTVASTNNPTIEPRSTVSVRMTTADGLVIRTQRWE